MWSLQDDDDDGQFYEHALAMDLQNRASLGGNAGEPKYKYRKICRVGGGANGDVWKGGLLGSDGKPVGDKPVAIKLLRELRFTEDMGLKNTLNKEANSLNKVGPHRNIVRFLGVGENVSNSSELGLLFEYCERGTLKDYLRDGVSKKEVASLMRQIRSGLKHIHDAQMMHCDLKPDNILVTFDGQLKIADFGLVRMMDTIADFEPSAQYWSKACGAWGYADPSVFMLSRQGKAVKGSRQCDIWSTGVILYEMLCGEPLFRSRQEWNAFLGRPFYAAQPDIDRKVRLNLPDNVPDELKDFLEGCLQVDPSRRLSVSAFYNHSWWEGEQHELQCATSSSASASVFGGGLGTAAAVGVGVLGLMGAAALIGSLVGGNDKKQDAKRESK